MRKRFAAAALTLCLMLSAMPVGAGAAEYLQDHGTFGNNLTWEVYYGVASGATLWIKGSGAMPDYQSSDTKPWNQHVNSINTISLQQGITSIGNYAFKGCSGVKSVNIPNSVRTIGEYAFQSCGLTSIDIPSGVSTIKGNAFRSCSGIKTVYLGMDSGTIDYGAFSGISSSATIYYYNLSSTTAGIRIQGLDSSGGGWLGPKEIFPGKTIHYTSEIQGSRPVYYTGVYIIYLDPAGGEVTPYRLHTERSGGSQSKTLSEPLPTPTRKCHTFACWSRARNDTAQALSNYEAFTAHTTVYAVWRPAHTGTPVPIPAVPPMCDSPGYTAGTRCSACGLTIGAPQEIPPTGHTPGTKLSETVLTEASCTADGEKLVTYECSVCQKQYTVKETISLLGHDWGEETKRQTKAPSCTEKGTMTFTKTCRRSGCGETAVRTEEIDKLDHTEVEIPAVPADCTTGGKTAGKKCSVCHTILEAPQDTQPTGHRYGPWNITEEPTDTQAGRRERVCSVCGNVEKEGIPPVGRYTVTFDAQGGSEVSPQSVTSGGKAAKPANPIRAGYDFGGWYKEAECATPWSFDADTVTGDITLYAKWTAAPKTCTITLDPNGGTLPEGQGATMTTGTDGKLSALPADPVRPGYTFDGWFTRQTGGTAVTTATVFTENATVYARWTRNGGTTDPDDPGRFTVTFDPNGGTGGGALTTGADGRLPALPANPIRPGYAFDGWFTRQTGGTAVTTATVFTENATVYARWTAAAGRYYQIYTPDRTPGGNLYVSHTMAIAGTRVTLKPVPRRGYELDWLSVTDLDTGREISLREYGADEYIFTMPTGDVEVEITFAARYTGGNSGGSGSSYNAPDPAPAEKKPIRWYYQSGAIYHVTDGLVPVGTRLTRDMLISVLYNLDADSTGEPELWATSHAVIPDIYKSWLWGADKPISREQAVVILYSYAQYKNYNTFERADLTGYSDYGLIRPIAQSAMSWARATGLITGTSASTLSPLGGLTCGQASMILTRFTGK